MPDTETTETPAAATPAPGSQSVASREERRTKLAALKDEARSLSELASLTPEQEARWSAILDTEFPAQEALVAADEKRAAAMDRVNQSRTGDMSRGHDTFTAPGQINREGSAVVDVRAVRGMNRGELRDKAMRLAEQRLKEGRRDLTAAQEKHLEKVISTQNVNTDGSQIARRLLITESDEYRSAFMKAIAHDHPIFNEAEARAIEEFRAANEGTGADGGFGIPVLIDPTIVLTSGAAGAPLLDVSRVVTITTNQWKGVTSPQVAFNWDGESSVVADGSPTSMKQPTVPTYKGDAFLPYTIEVDQDYPDFQGEMASLLEQGYIDLLAISTMTGSGSSQPTGIFTHMKNTTTNPAHVIVTTLGTLGAVDVKSAWANLPERFRKNARYVMHTEVENLIRGFGNGLALSDYTVNLAADGTGVLTGRPVILSDYAPQFTNTTGTESALVVGDFQQFLIVQRAGMTIELVQHLFDQATARPNGQRGWYAWARVGHDALVDNAFRLVANT